VVEVSAVPEQNTVSETNTADSEMNTADEREVRS
jgi:hypothetical protein